jgi:hypothetical protein
MSFLAKIFVDDQERAVLNADYLFYKTKDLYGQPTSQALGGQLDVALESTDHDLPWYDWMLSHDLRKKGHIRFYNRDGLSKLFDFEFWDCYCTGLHESFRSTGNMPMTLQLSLSPGIYRIRDYVFEKSWRISEPFSKNKAVRQDEGEQNPAKPRITGAFVNTVKVSADNKCENRHWLDKLGTRVCTDKGNFNAIEIQFDIEGELGTEYSITIERTVTYRKKSQKMENRVESDIRGPFNDPIKPENKQLKPVNGKVFSIDAPGFYHQIASDPRLSHILGIKIEANFLELARIMNSKGGEVDSKGVEWHSFIKIARESASHNFTYIDGKIGKGAIYG